MGVSEPGIYTELILGLVKSGRNRPMAKKVPLAIAYDFDGTLAPGNMQDHIFIPSIGMSKKAFWAKVKELSIEHNADNILIYMGLMLQKADAADVPVRKSDFKKYGKDLPLFGGVPEWFGRINDYGKLSGVRVDHYIISSGLREIIEGTEIAHKFKAIFASGFRYDSNNVAKAPALALNYTTTRISPPDPGVQIASWILRH